MIYDFKAKLENTGKIGCLSLSLIGNNIFLKIKSISLMNSL